MLDLMRSKGPVSAASSDIVMCQRGCPHQIRARLQILRILRQAASAVLHCLQQSFRQPISQRRLRVCGQITFHRVHHDIYGTGCRLILRHGQCILRIHKCYQRTITVVVAASL